MHRIEYKFLNFCHNYDDFSCDKISKKNGYLGQFSICLFFKAFLYSFIKYYSI